MRQFRIGAAFGIPIKVDLTFLLILPLFAWIIGSQIQLWVDQLGQLWGVTLELAKLTVGIIPWLLGITAAIGLFACVVLHELGHSVVARHYGYPIDSITLWIFGGIAQLSDMPEDWRQEFYIALGGPAVSIGLGVVCYLAFVALPAGLDLLKFLFGYLALMNLVLAAFNLLPGFPMDGGRVLRALLARNRPYARATQIAAEVGKGFAFLLGLLGLLQFNIILIGIAFFIYIGASGEAQQTVMKAAFEGVEVRDVMTPADEVNAVDVDDSVADLLDRMFRERHTGYPVMDDGRIVGLVTLEDAQDVRPVEREAFTVGDVMSTDLTTISAYTDAMNAFEQMQQNGIGRLIVIDDAEGFIGLITRSDLMKAFNIIQSSESFMRRRENLDDRFSPDRAP